MKPGEAARATLTPRLVCVIPAYRESPYLEACVRSLRAQTVPVDLIITTSTPNTHIDTVAARFGVPVRVKSSAPSISSDWNFALRQVSQGLVALCHQDDVYAPDFAEAMSRLMQQPGCLFGFANHEELAGTKRRAFSLNLMIKRWLIRRAFGHRSHARTMASRRKLLSLGNPVSCPSVVFNLSEIGDFSFSADWQINLDWDAWDRLCQRQGLMAYASDILLAHRVHEGSETTAGIQDLRRLNEDIAMFGRYWPRWVVACLMWAYKLSYRSNRVNP